ncbi:MAG: hypothetical protein M1371_10155 [Actinobacteria bacterium]|nr:hypothetical protein [Actinomycetota bacterium]MCL5986905.1 hypothetical protein [Actinomycetota bacterium]
MSKVFKTLASISIWILFIYGAGSVVWSIVDLIVAPEEAYNFADAFWGVITILSLFLAVVAIKIRKSVD